MKIPKMILFDYGQTYLFSWRTIPYQSFHNNPISDLVNNQLQIYYIIFWGVHHQKVILSSLSFPLRVEGTTKVQFCTF